jgi:hypothetical protein
MNSMYVIDSNNTTQEPKKSFPSNPPRPRKKNDSDFQVILDSYLADTAEELEDYEEDFPHRNIDLS